MQAVRLILEPRVTDAPLVVVLIVQGVRCWESDQVARVVLDALGEVLSVRCGTFFGIWSHLAAAEVILWFQVKEVEEIEVDLGSMVRGVRLSAVLNIAFLIAIEDVGCGTEGWENFTELVVLVRMEEACSDLVHGWHWAARCHVHP